MKVTVWITHCFNFSASIIINMLLIAINKADQLWVSLTLTPITFASLNHLCDNAVFHRALIRLHAVCVLNCWLVFVFLVRQCWNSRCVSYSSQALCTSWWGFSWGYHANKVWFTNNCSKALNPDLTNVFVAYSLWQEEEYSLSTNKGLWKVSVSSFSGRLVATSPRVHPRPNTTARLARGYNEVSLHHFYLGAFFLVCNRAFGVTADGDHDESENDPIENVDEDKWKDHTNPEWPLGCSAAI